MPPAECRIRVSDCCSVRTHSLDTSLHAVIGRGVHGIAFVL
jgi:hypothetical protein